MSQQVTGGGHINRWIFAGAQPKVFTLTQRRGCHTTAKQPNPLSFEFLAAEAIITKEFTMIDAVTRFGQGASLTYDENPARLNRPVNASRSAVKIS